MCLVLALHMLGVNQQSGSQYLIWGQKGFGVGREIKCFG